MSILVETIKDYLLTERDYMRIICNLIFWLKVGLYPCKSCILEKYAKQKILINCRVSKVLFRIY